MKMKHLKQYLCLILSSFLLISSTQLFAQDMPRILSLEIKDGLNKQVVNLKDLLDQLEAKVRIEKEAIEAVDFEKYVSTIRDMSKDIETFEDKYRALLGDVEYYRGKIKEIPTNPAMKQTLTETLAKRYYGSGAIIESSDITILSKEDIPGVLDFKSTIKESYGDFHTHVFYSNDVEKQLQAINRLRGDVTYTELFSIQSDLYGEAKGVFKKLEQVLAKFKPEEIWEKAFIHLTPEQQARVNLVIRASKDSKSSINLARDINRYLTKFKGTVRSNLWNTLKLSRELSRMAPEARIKYVDEITKLKPTEMHLARNVATEPRVASKFLKMGAPLMIVGVVLTAVSITEVNAQNAFPKFASITEKRKIQQNIENDEEVSAVSFIRWYTDPENASIIEKNGVHYMNLIGILFSAAQAEEDKEGILSVMNEMDAHLMEAHSMDNHSSVDMDYLFEKYGPQKDQVEQSFESVFKKYVTQGL